MTDIMNEIKKKVNKENAKMVTYISSYNSFEFINPHTLADTVRK